MSIFPRKIQELMDRLDRVQSARRSLEWQLGTQSELPEPTDPECPQSEEERLIVQELADPANVPILREVVSSLVGANPTAVDFFQRLLKIAERRASALE